MELLPPPTPTHCDMLPRPAREDSLVICGELNQQGDTFSESSDNWLEISVGTKEISVGKRRVSSEAIIKSWDALCVKRIGKMQGSDERGRRCEKELKSESQKEKKERSWNMKGEGSAELYFS